MLMVVNGLTPRILNMYVRTHHVGSSKLLEVDINGNNVVT